MKKSGWLIEAVCQVMAGVTAVIAFAALYFVGGNVYMVVQTLVMGVFGVVFWYALSGIGKCLKILEDRNNPLEAGKMEDKNKDELTYDEVALLYRSYEEAFAESVKAQVKINDLVEAIGERLSASELQLVAESNAIVIEAISMLQKVRNEVAEKLKNRGAIDQL